MPKTGVYCAFDFLQSCSSQEEVVTWHKMTSCDLRWPEVTLKWRRLTGSHLEVDGEGRKCVYCAFDFLQGCSSQEEAVTWQEMTSRDQVTRSDTEVTSFYRKSPGSSFRRLKTGRFCTFDFLQGCSSQEEAVTWQEMTSGYLMWAEVTRKWHPFAGSHLEVAVEGRKLAYT